MRYYFHIRNNSDRLEDTEGDELVDVEAAHEEGDEYVGQAYF